MSGGIHHQFLHACETGRTSPCMGFNESRVSARIIVHKPTAVVQCHFLSPRAHSCRLSCKRSFVSFCLKAPCTLANTKLCKILRTRSESFLRGFASLTDNNQMHLNHSCCMDWCHRNGSSMWIFHSHLHAVRVLMSLVRLWWSPAWHSACK